MDGSWGTHLHDMERRNYTPSALTLPPKGSWRRRVSSFFSFFKKGSSAEFVTSPAIYKGVVYVGSKNNRFYALDLDRGKLLWEFKPEAGVDGPATVTEDKVLFGSIEGVLYCLQRDTGKELWRFSTRGEITAAPAVEGDRVYLISADNRVYALSIDSGERLWTYVNRSPQYVSARLDASPAVSEGKIFSMFNDGWLVSLEAVSGKELWKKRILGEGILSPRARRTPLIFDGLLYVIDGAGYIRALDSADGAEVIAYDMARATDFIVTKKRIYSTDGERLIAISRSPQGVLWTVDLGHGEAYSMAFAGGHVVIISNLKKAFLDIPFLEEKSGFVTVYTAERGKEVWGERIRETVHSSAAISEDHIAVVTTDGMLSVFGTK
ncbi:MAG: PQQ-binding-like beta-propeller repeat protein [Deltaproteobacteria bacterium]|nr:PQQ-binding-like beta-propeller repeat protein [Deltaproteobacteria bacterium]